MSRAQPSIRITDDEQTTSQELPAETVAGPAVKLPEEEKYFRVKFSNKTSRDDEEFVVLSVNGETLNIERNIVLTLPERFVVAARNARYPQFSQRPGELRKQVGEVMLFPFDTLGEGKKEDYDNARRFGDEKMRNLVAGLNVT